MLAVGWFELLASSYKSLLEQATAVLLLVANHHFAKFNGGYFFNEVDFPLLHCWSLAVEEQFYLIYPFFIFVLVKLGVTRHRIFAILVSLFVASFALSCVLTPISQNAAFYLLPSRAWEMILGGLATFTFPSSSLPPFLSASSDLLRSLAASLGLFLILLSYFLYSNRTPYPSYHALLPCVGTFLFLCCSRLPDGTLTLAGQIHLSPSLRFDRQDIVQSVPLALASLRSHGYEQG